MELTVTLIGAFTFSTIPQILGSASNRGTLATLAGLVGGAAPMTEPIKPLGTGAALTAVKTRLKRSTN